jgi:steroid delta-isomerase-like uncharacterized protein
MCIGVPIAVVESAEERMMPAENLEVMVKEIYDAYESRSFERAAGAFAEDAELHNVPTGDRYRGREGYLQFARGWAAAFPDLRVDLQRLDAGGSACVVEYTLRGTHTGALITSGGFIPPTWASVEIRICDVLRMDGGLVERLDSYFDSATMLRQMGLFANSPLHSTDRRAALDLYATEVDASAEQRNKAIVHRFLEEVLNQKNPTAAVVVCAPDMTWHGGAMGEARDLPSFQSRLASIFTSFPDLHVEIHDVIAEEDRVAVRLTLHGTHLGEFQGVPPTGKTISSAGLNTYRIGSNGIVEEWWQNDILGVLRQLNAMPAPLK